MKKLRDNLFISLTLPLTWTIFLVIDLVAFADGRPQHLISRICEDLVFASSFLFFQIHSPLEFHHDLGRLFLPFFLQFIFWWATGLFIVWVNAAARAGNKAKVGDGPRENRGQGREKAP